MGDLEVDIENLAPHFKGAVSRILFKKETWHWEGEGRRTPETEVGGG